MIESTEQALKKSTDLDKYGVVGNGRTALLIAKDGSVDFGCFPDFDCGATFLKILDANKGGYFGYQIVGAKEDESRRQYVSESMVLSTDWTTPEGAVSVRDFMEFPGEEGRKGRSRFFRVFNCVRGRLQIKVLLKPTFNFAREEHQTSLTGPRFVSRTSKETLIVDVTGEAEISGAWRRSADTEGLCEFIVSVSEGESVALHLDGGSNESFDEEFHPLRPTDIHEIENRTLRLWKTWCAQCSYDGRHFEEVIVSAMILKLLFFEPTGGFVAAVTTSLPELPGGEKNWDYRYVWHRDGTLIIKALAGLGFIDEPKAFMKYLRKSFFECHPKDQPWRNLYPIKFGDTPKETELTHLDGYLSSKPVRIGNEATHQLQLDLYGETIGSIARYVEMFKDELTDSEKNDFRNIVTESADFIVSKWSEPDAGIWELRGPAKHYVHSKAMCWVTLERALELSDALEISDPKKLSVWRAAKKAVAESIHDKGIDKEGHYFVSHYGSREVDASLLRLPFEEFIDAECELMTNTTEEVQRQLGRKGWIYRNLAAMREGPEKEYSFICCAFWMVSNFCLQGKVKEAATLFEELLKGRNELGLYPEEIDPDTGSWSGNFPQGYSHISLILSALRLHEVESGKRASPNPARRFH